MSFEEFFNSCLCYSAIDDVRQQLFRFHAQKIVYDLGLNKKNRLIGVNFAFLVLIIS